MNGGEVNNGEPGVGPADPGRVPDSAHVTQELQDALSQGRPLRPSARVHLESCPDCREEWAMLWQLQDALLHAAASVPAAPPAHLRTRLLRQVAGVQGAAPSEQKTAPPEPTGRDTLRPSPHFRLPLLRVALGAAALVATFTVGGLLLSPPGLAHALPDPAVVVNAGGPLLVASNGAAGATTHTARLSIISGERVSATLEVASDHPAWFTEGVALNGRVYLADAGNDRVLELQPVPLRLLRSYPVGGGVAGLGTGGGRVYYKSVRGQVGLLPTGNQAGRSMALAQEGQMPMEDVMDGVLLQGQTLYVTHHLRGELCLLDPQTLAVRRRVVLGGMPVALSGLSGGLLVLDVQGRLLRLNAAGDVQQTWKLPGQPDKLVLNAEVAVVTDRAGGVTQLDLRSGAIRRVRLKHPMDVALTSDGHLAVAQGQTGVALLGKDLKPMPGGDLR